MDPRLITVVTTASQEGYAQYGLRFLASFIKYWPPFIRLILMTEGWGAGLLPDQHALYEKSEWLTRFMLRNKDRPKPSSYRFDAAKFAHKVAAIRAADQMCYTQYLLWLDADIITHTEVTEEDIRGWTPGLTEVLSWLTRNPKVINYPECGFLLFNRCHPQFRTLMLFMDAMYDQDQVFKLDEQHDSFVWMKAVEALKLPVRSLSGAGFDTQHVLINSPLGHWFDHTKGPRKALGRSSRGDLKVRRTEPYWQR